MSLSAVSAKTSYHLGQLYLDYYGKGLRTVYIWAVLQLLSCSGPSSAPCSTPCSAGHNCKLFGN